MHLDLLSTSACAVALATVVAACSAGGGSGGPTSGSGGGAGTGGVTIYDGGGGSGDGSIKCSPGKWSCSGNSYYLCADDGVGRLQEQQCPNACDPNKGCVLCIPGTRQCQGTVSMICNADASALVHGRDCAEWGSTCGSNGYCTDSCGQAEITQSYVGCEYWPVPLANTSELDSSLFDYRVIVGNPNTSVANVTVELAGSEVYKGTVAAGGLTEITLPWIDGESFALPLNEWSSVIKSQGAYRLRSDQPVTVAQFNPFEYSANDVFSYTNDATLLLPSHVMTGDYTALTYVPFSRSTGTTGGPFPMPPDPAKYGDYVAIVGVSPEPTDVEVWVTANTAPESSGRFPYTPPFNPVHFTLQKGEVAYVTSAPPPDCADGRPGYRREQECQFNVCDYLDTCYEYEFDMTGTRIHASRPVEVFGGHVCAYVPYWSQACDHLEVQLAPIQTWGKQYVSRPMTDGGGPGDNLVRVVAAFDNTHVHVDPPQGGVSDTTLNANQWVEFIASTPFSVTGSEAIMVGQFLLGQNYTNPPANRGDPAMTVLVPSEQFRKDYIFVTPSSYNPNTNGQSFVLVIRPPGAQLTLDGQPLNAQWQPVGGKEVAIVPVDGGTHTMASDQAFGMIAYGLGSYTSYAYPAGLNLNQITSVVK